MRAVFQRVSSARVEVEGRVVAEIGAGLCVLVGVMAGDGAQDCDYLCRKILNLRMWPNEKTGRAWDQSVSQKGYEVLLVSQFTLYGQPKGNKLDFHVAMPPQEARPFYEAFVQRVQHAYRPERVKDGIFGAMMEVHIANSGPVTLFLDSRKPPGNGGEGGGGGSDSS
ncbi:hypothetical protein CLOP_g3276 [Closterium sp. NIES-67]|nr:hypothetical protein CLOP_g3276 [Closterium sp. NIES-67]